MKNLLLLTFAGLGERHNVGAPTFWKTVEGFIAARMEGLDCGCRHKRGYAARRTGLRGWTLYRAV